MCLRIETTKNNFPFVPNGKLIILGVPILQHITVVLFVKMAEKLKGISELQIREGIKDNLKIFFLFLK